MMRSNENRATESLEFLFRRHVLPEETIRDLCGALRITRQPAGETVKISNDIVRTEVLQVIGKWLLDRGEPEAGRMVLEKSLPWAETQQDARIIVRTLGMLAACN